MVDDGESFGAVEDAISEFTLPEEERDALWLFARTRHDARQRRAARNSFRWPRDIDDTSSHHGRFASPLG
jgi:hypothetical protein